MPTNNGYGCNPTALVEFLVVSHNEFLEKYRAIKKLPGKDFQRVSLLDATHAQLISYDAGRHLLPLVLAHCHYTVEAGQGMLVQYDLAALEKHLEQRFFIGRPMIDMTEIRMVFSEDVRNTSKIKDLRSRIPQKELSKTAQQQIATELHDIREICSVIHHLETSIHFLMRYGGDPNRLLAEYMEAVLKMDPPTVLISRELYTSCMLQHLLSVWRTLIVLRTQKLLEHGEDAFEGVPAVFKEDLTADQCMDIEGDLAKLAQQRDFFVSALLLFILIELREENASWADWPLCGAMDQQLDIGPSLLDAISDDVQCKHAVSVWLVAARLSQTGGMGEAAGSSNTLYQ